MISCTIGCIECTMKLKCYGLRIVYIITGKNLISQLHSDKLALAGFEMGVLLTNDCDRDSCTDVCYSGWH